MNEIDIYKLMITFFMIMASVFAMVKYMGYLLDIQKKYFDARLDAQAEKIIKNDAGIKANNELLHKTREEMSTFKAYFEKIEGDLSYAKHKIDQSFSFLTSLARDVNQIIGSNTVKIKKGRKDRDSINK